MARLPLGAQPHRALPLWLLSTSLRCHAEDVGSQMTTALIIGSGAAAAGAALALTQSPDLQITVPGRSRIVRTFRASKANRVMDELVTVDRNQLDLPHVSRTAAWNPQRHPCLPAPVWIFARNRGAILW
jgi:hypothetical protein